MNATSYQMRRHPIVTFLAVMILGPYLLAVALVVFLIYAACTILALALGNHR